MKQLKYGKMKNYKAVAVHTKNVKVSVRFSICAFISEKNSAL